MPKTDTTISVGDKAPEFTLSTYDGKPMKLSEFTQRGKVMLLFFRGTW